MFRILCDPSSGSTELRLTEITRNFEPVVCVYGPASRTVHAHHRFKITLPNTDQTHDKISETLWVIPSKHSSVFPDDGSHKIRNMSERFLIF